MLTLREIVEYRLADAIDASERFEDMGMFESADEWELVAGVLARILAEADGK
jgi:hypothetical protein